MGNGGAFELVTGHGPEPHVDADDHALLYASFIGSGVYRLTGVKTAEIEVTSENEVTISPGMFLIHGRFARIKDPISLPIETGSQGQNRNDLVVCEYSYSGNETEIDDMDLVVVTGTPANPGSETDPPIEDDLTLFDIEYGGSITDETIIQVPLWRVPKEGLTTQDPVALFKDYVDATTARDSISQVDVLFSTDNPIKTTAALPGTNNAGDYDLVEVVYVYDLEGGKPIQNSCKINPKIPNAGFNLIAAGRSGDTFQFAERILAFSSNGLTLANSEYFVNFGSSTGSVAYRSTNSDYHLGVVAVLGYRNVLNFTSQ